MLLVGKRKERNYTAWTLEKQQNMREVLSKNRAANAINSAIIQPYALADGMNKTEDDLGIKRKGIKKRLGKLALSRHRPMPWNPKEDHALAANLQGAARIPGRCNSQRARRTNRNPAWSHAEDEYILTWVPRCNRDLVQLTTDAHKNGNLMGRGQGEIKHRYILLLAYRARNNPHMSSPNKEISPNLDADPNNNPKQPRPVTIDWTQNEDEALVNAVFMNMQNPNIQIPDFRTIAPFVTKRDEAQCRGRFAVIEQRYWI